MSTKKIVKFAVLNLGIVFLDIIFFSEGLLEIKIGGNNIFQTALGITIILMSIIIFIYSNYKILFEKKENANTIKIKTDEDCIEVLKHNNMKKTFTNDIQIIIEQIDRFNKKKKTINEILLQKFNSKGMSYSKFDGAVQDLQRVLFANIKSIINKLNAFDEEDYIYIQSERARKNYSRDFIQAKMSIYNEYINFIKEAVEDNEEILLKLDRLLLEISNFNSLEDGEIENMPAMKAIDELIKNTKLFKN